jgi:hypothetical protein
MHPPAPEKSNYLSAKTLVIEISLGVGVIAGGLSRFIRQW